MYRVMGALSVLLAAGCAAETGILVAVTGSDVEQLEFHVGVLDSDGDYVLDELSSGDRVSVRGRNLRAEPYELLLQESDAGGAAMSVRVLALAYREEEGEAKLTGFAVTEPPQRFIRDEVVRRSITIANLSNSRSVTKNRNCVQVRSGDEHFDLVSPDDRDCDGVVTADDCEDGDGSVFPGAVERCDGKDNNCDGVYAPREQACYARQEQRCLVGTRICLDAEGKGFEGDCQPTGDQVPMIYCERYDKCGMACADAIERRKLSCTVEIAKGGDGAKAICPEATYPLDRPEGAKGCLWAVESNAAISVKLEGKDGHGLEVENCEEQVNLIVFGQPPAAEAAEAQVIFYGEPAAIFDIVLTTKLVEVCSDKPVVCR